MKRVLIIGLGLIAGLVLLACGGFVWGVFFQTPRPATLAQPGPTGRRVTQNGVFGNYYPANAPSGLHPAVLVLGGSPGGLSDETNDEAVLLQREGFNALNLAYYNAPGKRPTLERVPLETFSTAVDWLKRQPGSDPARIGIIGYSKGAEAALLVATHYPKVKALVLGMPSDVVWDGMSFRGMIFHGVSSWTHDGGEIRSLAYAKPDRQGSLLSRFGNAEKQLPSDSPVRLPIEKFGGQVLLICGVRDSLWPSCPMARSLLARDAAFGKTRSHLLTYEEAGHGVMGPPMPEQDPRWRRWLPLGGTTNGNAKARADGWPKIVTFLEQALAPQP